MLVTDLESMLDHMKNAPLCDGNHEWVIDDDVDEDGTDGQPHCAKCFVVKED